MSVLSSPRSPHRFIAGRRRLRTSRRGAASAIAVTFIILILVGGLANYLANTLPTQERAAEFQHVLQVENELKQLQADILAEAAHPQTPMSLAAPLVLGSPSLPPYGAPADSVLGLDPTGSMASQFGFSIATIHYPHINWNPLSGCISGGAGHCSGEGHTTYYNWSGNSTTLSVSVTGGNDNLILNLTGSNDVISISYNGNNQAEILIALQGNDDSVQFSTAGSSSTLKPINFIISGTGDTYSALFSGASGTNKGFSVVTQFIGTQSTICPSSDSGATDSIGPITTSASNGRNLNQSLIFWNNVGRFTGPTRTWMPTNGEANNNTIIWQNKSGFVPCAFTQVQATDFNQSALGGLFMNLANRFYPSTTFDFEQGAIILGGLSGSNSTMVSPFPFSASLTPEGWTANLTLIQFEVSHFDEVNGAGSVAIQTQFVKESTFQLVNGQQGNTAVLSPEFLNITTPYPQAWTSFFAQYPQVISGTVVYDCATSTAAICAAHAGQDVYVVVAPVYTVGITLRVITVSLTLEG